MKKIAFLAGMVMASTPALAASPTTDFAIRQVGGPAITDPALLPTVVYAPRNAPSGRVDMSGVSRLGAQWGRVTSTYRSPEHNRRVGGVRNSWHIQGRAIDIARRPGVAHAQIAQAFRAAGYRLIESLDEGDHSHFAFGGTGSTGGAVILPDTALTTGPRPQLVRERTSDGKTVFRMVFAPAGTR